MSLPAAVRIAAAACVLAGLSRAAEPSPVTLTAEEQAWLRAHPVITVTHDPAWPPVEFVDKHGGHAGMTADYLRLVEQRVGIRLQRVPSTSWQDVYARLRRWEIDVATCVAENPERHGFWVFTRPYLSIPVVIATRSEVIYVGTMGELVGKKVALVKNYAVDDWVSRDWPGIDLVRVGSPQEGLALLERGEVFAYLDTLLIISDHQARHRATNVKIAGQTPYTYALGMAVRKDWAPLAGILDKALASTSAEEREAIYRRWVPLHREPEFNYALLWRILAVCGVLVTALLLWNRRLAREIAQRRQAEAALRETTTELDRFFNLALDLLCIADTDGYFRRLNPQWESVLGHSLASLQATRFLDLVHPDDLPDTLQAIARLGSQQPVLNFVNRYRCRDGTYRWIEWRSFASGKLIYAAARDITERKQAEDALRENERRWRALIEKSHDTIVLLDADMTVLFNSSSITRLLGYAPEERLGRKGDEFAHPDDREALRRSFAECVAQPGSVNEFRTRNLHRDGSTRWIEGVRTNLLHDPAVRAVVVNIRDITERKQAEDARRLFEFSIDQASDAVFWMTRDAGFSYVNNQACRALGYTREELLRLRLSDIDPVFPAEIWARRWETYQEGRRGGSEQLESRHRRRDGSTFPVEVVSQHLWFGEMELHVAFVRDITERKQAEAELFASRQMLRMVLDTIPTRVFWKDHHHVYLGCNRAFARDCGLEETAIIGRTDADLVTPDLAQAFQAADRRIMETGAESLAFDEMVVRPDGCRRWLRTNKVPLRDRDGEVVGVLGTYEDVTQEKEAAAAVRESEERFRRIFEHSRAIMLLIDPDDGRIAEANPAAAEFYGYPLEKLRQMRIEEINQLPPAEVEAARQEATRASGAVLVFSHRLASGAIRTVEVRSSPVSVAGRPLLFSIIQDITERRQAEAALQESLSLLQATLESTADGILAVDIAGRITSYNQRFADLWGLPPECLAIQSDEAAMQHVLEQLADPAAFLEGVRRIYAQQVADSFDVLPLRDGRVFERYSRLQLLDGAPVGRVWSFRDITERRRAESALRESEARFRQVVESAPMPMGISGASGRIEYINPRFHEVLGYSLEEVANVEEWFRRAYPEAGYRDQVARRWAEALEAAAREKRPSEIMDVQITCRDGSTRTMQVFGAIMGERTLAVFNDITERTRAEHDLRASLDEKVALLKEVHHRVKNNLQIVASLLNLQARKVRSHEVQVFLRDTQSRIRAMSLLHETLYGSDNLARVNCRNYVREVCTHITRSYASDVRNIELHQEVADVRLPLDQAIPAGLILNELVSNALKHAFVDRPRGRISIRLAPVGGDQLELVVSDDGVGLPADRAGGAGTLGLLLVENLTRQLDGQFSVLRGGGTTIRVVFPIQPA